MVAVTVSPDPDLSLMTLAERSDPRSQLAPAELGDFLHAGRRHGRPDAGAQTPAPIRWQRLPSSRTVPAWDRSRYPRNGDDLSPSFQFGLGIGNQDGGA